MNNKYPPVTLLVDEEHFFVLGEGPEFVIDDEFQVIDVVADLLDEAQVGAIEPVGFLGYAWCW